jgi:microcystin-dependent protein
MAAVNLSPIGNGFQFFSNDGLPLNAGKIFTYQAGSTTPLATYTDSSGLIANTNPIILGPDGRPPSTIWLLDGFFYKFVLKTSADVTIQTYDNLYGIINAAAPAATPIPVGGILLWSGSIGSIPAGYVLCNGSNGTPDLRDRFVVGAGSTYAVNATGGSANAITVTHTHTVTDAGHTHFLAADATVNTNTPVNNTQQIAHTNQSSAGVSAYILGGTATAATVGKSSTSTTGIVIDNAGTSGTNANLPPYYALCYIMKT